MSEERRSTPLLCGRIYVREDDVGDDEAIACLATRQHGVVARRQLIDIGVKERSIDHRLASGRLRRVFRGAYTVGHDALRSAGDACAGVLAAAPRHPLGTTPRVAASHMSSVALRGLVDRHPGAVHITCPGFHEPQPGLVAHRSFLAPDELEIVDGIPATSVARTLLDLSAIIDRRALRRLIKRAEFLSLVRSADLVEILQRYPRRKGRRNLAALVADGTAASGRTRSELEDEFLAFCRRRRLPRPETNQLLHLRGERFEVDCVWRDQRLAVELDGWQAHGGRTAFEDDRARDRALAAEGWTIVRITWRQLRDDSSLAGELRALLGRRT